MLYIVAIAVNVPAHVKVNRVLFYPVMNNATLPENSRKWKGEETVAVEAQDT